MAGKAKIAAFAIVMLAAVGLLSRGLHGTAPFSTHTADQGAPEGTCPYGDAGCGTASDFVPGLSALIGERDFVFVILPGESQECAEAVRNVVDGALAKISARGVSAASLALGKDVDGHAELVGNFAIESFPSVIAVGRGHRAAAVSDDITEAKLLRAFVVASTRASCCGPGCAPSACDQ